MGSGEYILLGATKTTGIRTTLVTSPVSFVFVSDIIARALAVQSGDADIALDASLPNFRIYDADPNIKAHILDTSTVSTLFLNSGNGGPLEDVRYVRPFTGSSTKKPLDRLPMLALAKSPTRSFHPTAPWDGIVESKARLSMWSGRSSSWQRLAIPMV